MSSYNAGGDRPSEGAIVGRLMSDTKRMGLKYSNIKGPKLGIRKFFEDKKAIEKSTVEQTAMTFVKTLTKLNF